MTIRKFVYDHGLENVSFDNHLSSNDFTPQALPRSGTDYGAAADHEGWAKHYEGIADSWANSGYLNKAAEYQDMANSEHQKASGS